MKENSIEEDVKILEKFIKYYEAEATSRKFRGTLSISVDEDEIDALENLINMYKRVLKENEKYKRLAEMNLKNAEEFKENMCEHRCLLKNENEELKQENEEKTTILLAGAEKVKQLEKENKDLKADNYELNNRITDLLENIPVQKIKDKIEELKKKVEELTDEQGYWGGSDLLEQIKVLEEILEKEQ